MGSSISSRCSRHIHIQSKGKYMEERRNMNRTGKCVPVRLSIQPEQGGPLEWLERRGIGSARDHHHFVSGKICRRKAFLRSRCPPRRRDEGHVRKDNYEVCGGIIARHAELLSGQINRLVLVKRMEQEPQQGLRGNQSCRHAYQQRKDRLYTIILSRKPRNAERR